MSGGRIQSSYLVDSQRTKRDCTGYKWWRISIKQRLSKKIRSKKKTTNQMRVVDPKDKIQWMKPRRIFDKRSSRKTNSPNTKTQTNRKSRSSCRLIYNKVTAPNNPEHNNPNNLIINKRIQNNRK